MVQTYFSYAFEDHCGIIPLIWQNIKIVAWSQVGKSEETTEKSRFKGK